MIKTHYDTINKPIATEAGHWYLPDGSPYYEVNGRPTTLRDARKLGAYPSVTTVLSILPKPFLDVWKQKQALMSALTLPGQFEGETHDQYIARILEDSRQQAENARQKGNSIHGACELFLQGKPYDPQYEVYCRSAFDALSYHLAIIKAQIKEESEAERSFASPLGYGGKVDLHSIKWSFVCDFKTKEFGEDTKKLDWDEHKIQLEAYRHGLGMPDARMINVFISTNNPGLVRVVEHDNDDPWAWEVFLSALDLWKKLKKYDPVK